MLLAGGKERLHRLDRIEIDQGAAELPNRFEMFPGEEFFLFASAALGNVDGREKSAVGKFPVEDQFHVTGAFEFLEDDFVMFQEMINELQAA